jgi:DUF971 family protein
VDDENEPATVDIVRDEGVRIEFVDGYVAQFDLVTLRRGCPCAFCRELRDHGEEAWPRPGSPTPLRIDDADFHGAWGLAITWNDGHRTGIFAFEYLRSWHDRTPTDPNSSSDHRSG